MHRIFLLIIILMGTLPIFSGQRISDMGAALDFCREAPLDKIEGIWEFPADNTVVLISRDRSQPKTFYNIIVVSTPDCRLNPGDKIGEMTPSVDQNKYLLSLYRSQKNNLLSDPGKCSAIFNDKDGTIKVEARSLKVKISSRIYSFLPQFWRLLSMFKVNDPAASLPDGLVRIYPYPAPSKADYPRYL
ncbi:MAG: hypothetical protein K2N05_01255 [Muribaculaceae bacterium]|nr:hypothetical protein [Muribaculaceae bacterium]